MSLLLLALLACNNDDGKGNKPDSFDYPLDDVLRFNHLQAVGTHNSYHVETTPIPEWNYTHLPLDQQLANGVRQFELDMWFEEGRWQVFHVPLVDAGTTCETPAACAQAMKDWSDDNPAHHPVMVLLELKSAAAKDAARMTQLEALEAEIESVWPRERVVTPDRVRGDRGSLREAIEKDGWPTLGTVRGTVMWVLHDGGSWRDAYYDGDTTGAYFMPDGSGDLDLDIGGVHTMNDPWDPDIAVAVERNHLVRTRADSDTQEARDNDTSKRDQAIASGAHWVSTDFPIKVPKYDYVVEIPGGTPSRCHTFTAPKECASLAIEDPAFIE